MSDEQKNPVSPAIAALHPEERGAYKLLLLSNANYFGNLAESPDKAVVPIVSNTSYEELACVGYHPQQERLEAVVYLYQPTGYGTDLCGAGTPEYVRFYLSFDNGATWQDEGAAGFQAHDIPGTDKAKRLEFAVSLAVSPARKLCWLDSLIQVRAILAWNHLPPANTPGWKPVWGNVREATIQVEPLRLPPLSQVLAEVGQAKLAQLGEVLDLAAPVATQTKALGLGELAALYKGQDVPVHRFAYQELHALATGKSAATTEQLVSQLPGGFDSKLFGLLFPKTDGDTSYEQLRCIGLDPNSPNTLVGVIQVKKSAGYSGGPCTSGSREHVTFWADFDGNGSFETWLGTAHVQVYDLAKIPPAGVFYAVRLPVDLSPYRQSCKSPKVVRIRAILSWNVPVPAGNPNQVPTWGNREETLINIAPGAGETPGKIAILGGIAVSLIDGTSGLTNFNAIFSTNNLPPDSAGRPCPFGGRVTVQGAPLPGHSYKVEVIPDGGVVATPVVTALSLTRWDGTTYVHKADPVTLRFAYVPFSENIESVLAQWDTWGDDKWTVRLSTFDGSGNPVGTDEHVIQLDNTAPVASIHITSGTGDCGKFAVGDGMVGNFTATDLYFGSYSLDILPGSLPSGMLAPTSGTLNTPPAPGVWTLNTGSPLMKPCGYVIRVRAWDRAILNSQGVGHEAEASAGFCLEASTK